MDIWNDFILPELLTAAKDDRDYQKCWLKIGFGR